MKLFEGIREFVALKSMMGARSRKTAVRYESSLRIFCLCMQDPLIEDIELSHIIWYLQELDRLGWKPNGINLIGLALRKFFEFCHLRKYPVAFNETLIPLKEKTFSIPRVTSQQTFQKLIDQIPFDSDEPHHIRNRAILMMLWDTGVRTGELMSLDIADLDLGNMTALIKTEKSRGRRPLRQIFWTKETHECLSKWLNKLDYLKRQFDFCDSGAAFVTIAKSPQLPIRGGRMNPRGVAEVMRVLSNQAGLPIVANAHGIRHAMGRDVIRTLKSNSAVSNILGHSSLESSYVYTMLFGNDLREQWQEVVDKRAQSNISPPNRSSQFPKFKNDFDSVVKGQIKPVKVKSGKNGKWLRA
jgi:integrase/recombinase XerC